MNESREPRTPVASTDGIEIKPAAPRMTGAEAVEAACRFIPSGRAGACAVIRTLLVADQFAEELGLPPIAHWESKYPFRRGRVDFALFHVDGTVTLVEVKDKGADRDVQAGIGQLAMYAMQANEALHGTVIRRVLAVSCEGDGSTFHLARACRFARVMFAPLGTVAEHRYRLAARLAGRDQ